MTFDSPLSLFWLALGVPIVVFYILKIRLRRQPVSTILFWSQVLNEQNPRSIWQRLRHLVSLLLQLAMLSLLAFAAGDPFFFWEVRSARRIVLVVDNSASMNATDVSPNRLSEAKRQAEQLIAGMRHRDEFALIAAGTQPRVVVGFTSRQKTVHGALQSLPPTDGSSHVAEAVALGRRLLGEREDGKQREVIVFTDGRFLGVDELSASTSPPLSEGTAQPADSSVDDRAVSRSPSPDVVAQIPVTLRIVGARSANVGITQFQVRRSLVDPLGYEILAEVTNASDQPVECRFEVELNSEAIDVVPLKMEAGGKWSQVFEKTSASGGHLVARLNHDDALATDNTASAVLPKRDVQPVLLVTSGNLFLQKVFEVNPLVKLTIVAELPATIPAGTLVVYHRVTPEKIPPGPAFIIDPANATDLFGIGEQISNPIVTRQDKDSLLMSHVRLDNVLMPEARALTPLLTDQTQVLAEAVTKEPLFFAVNRPDGRVLVLTVNLDKGDLPLRTAFPITVANSLHWFAGSKGDLRESLPAGSLATLSSNDFLRPAKGQKLLLQSPTGEVKPLPSNLERMTIGPLDHCGIWSIREEASVNAAGPQDTEADTATTAAASPLVEIACNLASATESDVRPPESLLTEAVDSPIIAGLGSRPVWFWLLLAGLILTTAEWAMYQRRVIS